MIHLLSVSGCNRPMRLQLQG